MKPTKAQKRAEELAKLKNKVAVSEAHDIMSLKRAHTEIARCGTDRYMASGVIITVTDLSGKKVMTPAMVKDGLSPETIAAIRADLERTHKLRLALAAI